MRDRCQQQRWQRHCQMCLLVPGRCEDILILLLLVSPQAWGSIASPRCEGSGSSES
uniref:Uncharacterized protein n=1 Tax=Arundo donax TaxID=35708 RepID=A0A0A9AKB6_ARUDO